jgi:hypothetical protein
MTANRILELMNQSPFMPLEFHLNNGTTILVENPYEIAVKPNGPDFVIFEATRSRYVACRNISEIITGPTTES